jgi:hypothetical protein
LSRALTLLRDGFDKMGIRLKEWFGAGSAAGALITKMQFKMQLRKNHFPPDIGTIKSLISKQQLYADFGNAGK